MKTLTHKLIIVGKLFESNKNNGSGHVLLNLLNTYAEKGVNVKPILYKEDSSKFSVLCKIIKHILFSSDNIVNVHTDGYFLSLCVYFCSRLNRKNKYFLTVHGLYIIESKIHKTTKNRYLFLEKLLYRKFNNVICVSELLKQDITKIYGRKKNIFVIENGTDAIKYQFDNPKSDFNKNVIFIMAGGINRRKGIYESLQFVSDFISVSKKSCKLIICGNIENEQVYSSYKELLNFLNLKEVVEFKGMIKNKESLYKLFAMANFQLCLSKYDSFNVAVIEGLAMGCPCIVSNNCGASHIVRKSHCGFCLSPDKGGYILGVNQINALSKEAYKNICNNTQKIKNSISWENIAEKYFDLFERNDL